jgi:hypothetical protein
MKLWIARDEGGWLWLFDKKPVLRDKNVELCQLSWFDMAEDGVYNYRLGGYEIFPEITFENSPKEIELKLVNN